jgi:hypothetical protein
MIGTASRHGRRLPKRPSEGTFCSGSTSGTTVMTRRQLPLLLIGALLLTSVGCSRNWYRVREENAVRVKTRVTVFTEPDGADVSTSGGARGQSPVAIPFVYRYRRVIYAREKSYVFTRNKEEKMLPEYFNNVFVIEVTKPGFLPAKHTLTLRGEKAKEVHIPLTPIKR